MKKIMFLLSVLLSLPHLCYAQLGINSMTDAQQLGAMAGVALACNAGSRLDDFELISSYIMGNSAVTDEERTHAFKEYATEKLRTYNLQRDYKPTPCPEVLTVKLPDGKIIKSKKNSQKKQTGNEPRRNYMIPAKGQNY